MSVNSSAAQGQNAYLSEPKGPNHTATNGGHLEGGHGAVPHAGGMPISRNNVSVTLSPEQFEQLYLQPGGVGGKGDLSKRLGNPTPLGIAGFLLCLTPFSVYAMGFGATNTTSAIAQIGPYWSLGGICMIIAGIMEWIIGNTFPFVVFTTFGGFWLSFGFLQNPAQGIVQAYGSAANPAFNASIGVYLVCWGVLNFIYLLGSLRTNVAFVCLFFVLDLAFFLLAAAYFRIADGRADYNQLLVAGGAFGFLTTLCGWYIMLCLVLGSTGMPFNVPLGDLSGFLSGKKA